MRKGQLSHHLSRSNWPLLTGGLIVLVIVLIAILGPDLAPRDALQENAIIQVGDGWKIPPFPAFTPGFLLGSDQFGRDLFSRLLWAVRPTMVMVTIVAGARLVIGVAIGLSAGWFSGWLGRALHAVISAALSVPVLMVALGAIAAIGVEVGIWAFIIGLSINGWVETARLVREQTRIVKGQTYVEAARALGASDGQVVLRHTLRQIMPMAWMLLAFEIGATLMVTAALGFLGYYIGGDVWVLVEDTAARRISGSPELGQMLATTWVRADEPWGMIAVGTVIFITVLGFNLLGRGLRDRLNLRNVSRRTFLGRVQGAIFSQITNPARRWASEHVTAPLRRETIGRRFYRVLVGLLAIGIMLGGLALWRSMNGQTPEEDPNVTAISRGRGWATERRDSQGTLWSQTQGPVAGSIEWLYDEPSGFSGGVAVSEEGILYVTSKDGTLHTLNADGSVRWRQSLPDTPVGTPALGLAGEVYVADKAGNLSAYGPGGAPLWRFRADADDFASSGPVVDAKGSIYYVVRGGTVQAVSSIGEELWRTKAVLDPIYSPPRVSADGNMLFVRDTILSTGDGSIIQLDAEVDVDQYLTGADGGSYLQSGNEIIQWRSTPSNVEPVRSTTWDHRQFTVRAAGGPNDAGVTQDQLVWLLYSGGLEDTRIVWLDMGGRTVGNAHYAQRVTQVIAVEQEATTYLCGIARSGATECMAVTPEANEPIWRVELDPGGKVAGGALVSGRLYVVLEEGYLYAIGAGRPIEVADEDVGSVAASGKALGPDSEEVKWRFLDETGFTSGPAISPEGKVFITSKGGTLYALEPGGATLWEAALPAEPVGLPGLDSGGAVYISDKEGNLSAFAPDGTPRWVFAPPESRPSTVGPVVGSNGAIYYTVGGSVQAVSRDGEPIWQTKANTFRNYTPLELDSTGDLLFFAEDVFSTQDGALLELESPVQADEFFVGNDNRNYLRSHNTIVQWQLAGSILEILEQAQWNYQHVVSQDRAPSEAGVTRYGTVWLFYTTPWGGSSVIAWVNLEGEILDTRTVGDNSERFSAGRVIGVVGDEAATYLCGLKNRSQGYRPTPIRCGGFVPEIQDPVWQVELDETTAITGGALAPGRLYVSTAEGVLYAVGEGQALIVAGQEPLLSGPAQPAALSSEPPPAEIAWVFQDSSGFSSKPAVSTAGTVYVASKGGTLYAFDPSGDISWQARLSAAPVGPPALGVTGEIYVADKNGNLSAFTPEGDLRWRFEPPESKPSTVGPLVGPDGVIYYTIGSSVQSVSPRGNGIWTTRSRTFRHLTPLQISPEQGMLFYADDAFRVEDGSLLELESPVNAEQFVAGKDGRLYLRDQHTVMQWELDGTRVKILESAQWDYTKFVGRGWVPDEAGVTEKGVIWTSYEDGNRVALMDGTGQLLGTVDSGLAGGDVVALLEPDLTLYVCGMEHFRTSRPYPYCRAFEPRTEEAIWEVELDVGQEVKGGVLVPGRLYVTTDQGLLYSIGQAPKTAQAEPAATVGKDRSPAPTPTAVRPTAAETEPEVTSAVPQPTLAPTAFPSVSVAAGAHMTVTIPVINQGPSDARRVIVTSTLPTGFALMSANASQGTGCDESDGQLVCQIGDLRNGAGAAITVVFGVDTTAAGIITYTSSVASSATDPDVLNNTQSRRAAVRGAADLSLLFIDAPDSAMAGLPFSYTLAIRNKGPEDATGVTITSTLPVSTTFVSATDDPDLTCTESDGSMTCTRAELAAGAGFSLQLVVSVDPSYVGTVNYRIYISAKEPDFEPWDNAVEKATVIDAEADLTIREMP